MDMCFTKTIIETWANDPDPKESLFFAKGESAAEAVAAMEPHEQSNFLAPHVAKSRVGRMLIQSSFLLNYHYRYCYYYYYYTIITTSISTSGDSWRQENDGRQK